MKHPTTDVSYVILGDLRKFRHVFFNFVHSMYAYLYFHYDIIYRNSYVEKGKIKTFRYFILKI